MQDAAAGGRGSGTVTPAGAAPGEMDAGLQMDDAGALRDAGAPAGADEAELEEEEEAELEAAAGGVNCPLLSEPELSRAGEDFFLAGRLLAPPPLCCCCRHLARRFLNQTWTRDSGRLIFRATSSRMKMSGYRVLAKSASSTSSCERVKVVRSRRCFRGVAGYPTEGCSRSMAGPVSPSPFMP